MIPKIIHFTWFSNDPYPPMVEECMASWKKYLPDYEFIHWNMDKISGIDSLFLKEALEKRKWAFAADFVRLYALFHHGGIYLDTDVEVYKSFDNILSEKAFIGRENSFHLEGRRAVRFLTSHCMGGEKGHPFFKACLDYYEGRRFVLSEEEWLPSSLKYDERILPEIQFEIAKLQGYNPSDRIKGRETTQNGLAVYPFNYFDCFYPKKISYCRHLALGGWRDRKAKDKNYFKDSLKKRLFIAVHRFFEFFHYSIFKNL